MLRGSILIIIPLLSLLADQIRKFCDANQAFCSVNVYHLDELTQVSNSKTQELLDMLSALKSETSSTIFLFSTPQFLIKHNDFRFALVSQARKGILRLIKLDEVHLHIQHGCSFRQDIRMLKDYFFLPIFTTVPEQASRPFVFCCSATMSQEYVMLLSSLISVGFPERARIWSNYDDFKQRSIHMSSYNTSNDYVKKDLNQVVQFLEANPTRCVCIFVNSRGLSHKLVSDLEKKLDASNVQVDVVHIHGHLDRFEKFYFTRIYCSDIIVPDFNPNVLVGTSAINVGIDNHRVDFIMRIGWPRDLFTFFQEKGRGSRETGSPSKCVVLADIRSYIDTLWSIFQGAKNHKANDVEPMNPIQGFNSAIKTSTQKNDALPAPTPTTKNDKYKLCSSMRRKLELRQLLEFHQVVHFHCLDNGCMQRRAEWIMSSGKYETPPHDTDPCETSCAICTREWHKFFLPVYASSVADFFDSSSVRDKLPLVATHNSLTDLLWKESSWINLIFDKSKNSIGKFNVESLLLQLISAKMIVVTYKNNNIIYNVNRVRDQINQHREIPLYHSSDAWKGIHTYNEETRPRVFKQRNTTTNNNNNNNNT